MSRGHAKFMNTKFVSALLKIYIYIYIYINLEGYLFIICYNMYRRRRVSRTKVVREFWDVVFQDVGFDACNDNI